VVWAARVQLPREKKGVVVREFPALVLFPALVFASLFSPPLFAAPQTPSRTKA
jgi:hypothetical protein